MEYLEQREQEMLDQPDPVVDPIATVDMTAPGDQDYSNSDAGSNSDPS